ncbi:MAG TPA: BamA/TamA family outer membrane protein [Gemmatimonadales bacterium]|nr:BamA/TamA family outer membrane protein [Gemmatimonadales bacterium]
MPSIARTAWIVAALGAAMLGGRGAAAQVGEGGLVVRQLRFRGNDAFPSDILAAAIATTSSSTFATSPLLSWMGLGEKRRLNELELRRDVPRLRLFYQIRGYLDAQVDTAVVRTPEDVYITFTIHEGEPVLTKNFIIKGLDSIPNGHEQLQDLPLREGKPFDRTLVYASADTIRNRLHDRGYAEALVRLEGFEVDREKRSASVSLIVHPGVTAVIGEIHVQGTRRIDSAFVRSLLASRPGREYRERDIQQSQLNLYRSELFRFASVGLDTGHFVPGSGVVPVTITVIEGPFHRIRAAAGYGTNDCFRTGAGWTARNALGSGQVFDVSAQVSKLGVGRPFGVGLENSFLCSALKDDSVGSANANYNITTSFRRPVFLSPSNSLTLSLFAERRSEFAVYLREDIGGSVTLIRETAERIPITLTYRLSSGRTQANAVSFCAFFNACTETDVRELRQRRPLATLTLGAQRVRVNNPLDPSRGSNISAEVTHSSTLLGSSRFSEFTRLIADGAHYIPVGSSVLALHARAGMVFAPRLVLGGAGDEANFVPPEQRFYAGGPNDVRGYNRNQLGPLVYVVRETAIDSAGTVPEDSVQIAATGGNSIVVGNVELRVPSPFLGDRLRFAVFADGGTVWERGGSGPGSTVAFRVTPGGGIRFVTPLGPVRVDAAYSFSVLPPGRLYQVESSGDLRQIRDSYQKTRKTGRGWVFQFSVGQAF